VDARVPATQPLPRDPPPAVAAAPGAPQALGHTRDPGAGAHAV